MFTRAAGSDPLTCSLVGDRDRHRIVVQAVSDFTPHSDAGRPRWIDVSPKCNSATPLGRVDSRRWPHLRKEAWLTDPLPYRQGVRGTFRSDNRQLEPAPLRTSTCLPRALDNARWRSLACHGRPRFQPPDLPFRVERLVRAVLGSCFASRGSWVRVPSAPPVVISTTFVQVRGHVTRSVAPRPNDALSNHEATSTRRRLVILRSESCAARIAPRG